MLNKKRIGAAEINNVLSKSQNSLLNTSEDALGEMKEIIKDMTASVKEKLENAKSFK